MTRHRYPRPALIADYLRGGAGLALTGLPLLALPLSRWVAAAFAVAAVVFALFTLRTAQRQWTEIAVDDEGIAARGPLGSAVRWEALARLRLRYFSTRRDRERGWMQLTLKGGGRMLSLDSTLDRFDAVVGRAARAARDRRLTLDPATRDNLLALGIEPGAETGPAEEVPPRRAGKGWFDRLDRGPDSGPATGTGTGPPGARGGSAGR